MRGSPRDFRRRLGAILALALLLRLFALDTGLWFDEIWTLVDFGRLPLARLLTTYGSDNNHPLYSLLARVSLMAFGEHPWALRLPALVFGLLAVVETGRLGRLVLGPRRGELAALLVAIAGPSVWFATNARGYTALLYFTILATRYLVETRADTSRVLVVKQALALALGTWVHATMVFVALAQFLGAALVLRQERRRRVLAAVLLAGVFSLVFHLPILAQMYEFLLGGEGHEKVTSSWTSPLWMLRETAARLGLPIGLAIAAAAVAFVVGLLGLARLGRTDPMLPIMVVGPALLGGGVMLALGRHLWPRFFFFELGFAVLVPVAALVPAHHRDDGPGRRRLRVALYLLLLVPAALSLVASRCYGPKQDFAGAARRADELPAGRVATVGLARMPYADYIVRPYRPIADAAELRAMLAEGELFVIATLPIWLETRQPEVAQLIRERGQVAWSFPGSLGGGDLVIWRLR